MGLIYRLFYASVINYKDGVKGYLQVNDSAKIMKIGSREIARNILTF
jgi:hypothetical protein